MKKIRIFTVISLLIANILYIISNLGIQIVQATEENNEDVWSISSEVETINFPVTIRDFNADYVLFEGANDTWMLTYNMVLNTIGSNSKPQFTQEIIDKLAVYLKGNVSNLLRYKDYASNEYCKSMLEEVKKNGLGSYEKSEEKYEKNELIASNVKTAYDYIFFIMNNWFNDVENLNIRDSSTTSLTLKKENSGKYTFDSTSSGFYPLDGEGFGNQGRDHNYHFTLESHTKFSFNGEELTFNFKGDDDVWVYLGGKLVINFGGVHDTQSASFTVKSDGTVIIKNKDNMEAVVEGLKLESGKWYDFDFFYMERHTTESNLKIETNINFIPQMSTEKTAYLMDDNGERKNITSNVYAYPGETIYYEFSLINDGNVTLENIEFVDDKLNIKINETGIYKDSTKIDFSDLEISKDDGESKKGVEALEFLKSLNVGEKIIVQSEELLKYLVIDNDAQVGKVENTVVSTAYHKDSGTSLEKKGSASVEVKVKDISSNPDESENKINVAVTKTIEKVTRESNIIYEKNDESVFSEILYPGDEVEFSFNITNNTVTPNGIAVAIGNLSIVDELTNYTTPKWIFYKEDGTEIDINNFSIGKGETIKIIVKGWTVPSKLSYDDDGNMITSETNTVSLYKKIGDKNIAISKSSVNIILESLTLNIKKVVEDAILTDLSTTTFTLKLVGKDSSGNIKEQFNIEAKANKEYMFSNLTYGLIYELSEIVPMNYQLINTCFKKDLSSNESLATIKMTTETSNYIGVITNRYINNGLFFDSSNIQNTLKYDTDITN